MVRAAERKPAPDYSVIFAQVTAASNATIVAMSNEVAKQAETIRLITQVVESQPPVYLTLHCV